MEKHRFLYAGFYCIIIIIFHGNLLKYIFDNQFNFFDQFYFLNQFYSLINSISLIIAIVVRIHLSYVFRGHRRRSDQHKDRDDVCFLYNSISFLSLIDDHSVFYIIKVQVNGSSAVP